VCGKFTVAGGVNFTVAKNVQFRGPGVDVVEGTQ
jgi:hypothetical protein